MLLCNIFMSVVVQPHIQQFIERFPAARDVYATTNLYHRTHSRYLPDIQTEGLRPHPELFPAEQGQFLLDMLQKYGSGHPNHAEYVRDKILSADRIYLSTVNPDLSWYVTYGIPERLTFLMRGLSTLATKSSLTDGERNFAAQSLEEHRVALTENNPALITLEIDPLAPGIMNSRLGGVALQTYPDEAAATAAIEYIDGGDRNNIAVQEEIEPSFIRVYSRLPIDPERAMLGVDDQAGWASSIR
jgi:hypothetical protein